jgi:hypothetical protein
MGPSATYESGHFYFAQTGHSHFAATVPFYKLTSFIAGAKNAITTSLGW